MPEYGVCLFIIPSVHMCVRITVHSMSVSRSVILSHSSTPLVIP